MVSIPPTPPPPAKRKKYTAIDEPSTDLPPAKTRKIHASDTARTNEDEVHLESDSESEDGYGPAVPNSTSRRASIGPAPPPQAPIDADDGNAEYMVPVVGQIVAPGVLAGFAIPVNTDEVALDGEEEDEDEDIVGPASPKPKRVHGPAPPPADLSERPPADPEPESDSDSDDDYGPALPSSTSHQQRQARALEAAQAQAQAAKSEGPKRDEWMIAPPSAGGYRAGDPTKLKARRFNSGPRSGSGSGGSEISSIWTETPEEKRKRLENAVLGRDTGTSSSNPPPQSSSSSSSSHSRPQTKADAARIQNFTEATRGRSLYEEHQAARARGDKSKGGAGGGAKAKSWADEEDDDPSKRAFDKEKDMKLGGRIGASQRRELLNKAADFGGRFAKGKYL
ncbi:hypothetical protein F5Y09DRAFT_324084 [Xylaria sp. FL1042]|nr:hypothetical protein F5Y09DRAFT_324084 [Xylaria sp. FL1042]